MVREVLGVDLRDGQPPGAAVALHAQDDGELRRALGGTSEKVLVQRLRALGTEGLVSREVDATVPPGVTYAMTDHGQSLCAMIEAMAAWGAALGLAAALLRSARARVQAST